MTFKMTLVLAIKSTNIKLIRFSMSVPALLVESTNLTSIVY